MTERKWGLVQKKKGQMGKKSGREKLIRLGKDLWRQKFYHIIAISGVIFIFFISYASLFGLQMAFRDYKVSQGFRGIFTAEWVGLEHFREFFLDANFPRVMRNTICLSMLKLLFGIPAPIIFAVMLSEMRYKKTKKIVQTVSYLPHFLSWVIVAGILNIFLASTKGGLINSLLLDFGLIEKPIGFMTNPSWFWAICVISDVWKEFGWWAIIYVSAISAVDPALYEAMSMDGAGRLQKIRYLTLPAIKGTIGVVAIISLGNLFTGGMSGSNFDQAYLLGNAMTTQMSEILPTYVYKMGILTNRFSYATAVGLFQSVVSLLLVFGSNALSSRVSEDGQGALV